MSGHPSIRLLLIVAAVSLPLRDIVADDGLFGPAGWVRDGFAAERFILRGTQGRNNPLRRMLRQPFHADDLFVSFRLRYAADSLDVPGEESDGEFVVLWLDATEGNSGSTHSSSVPNIGIHVKDDRNHFMVRYAANREKYAAELQGDRDYLVVARLWKSVPGKDEPFDHLHLWVDPDPDSETAPHASVSDSQAIAGIYWLGFSTGRKTEFDDRIEVWDIGLAQTWESVLGLPPRSDDMQLPEVPPEERTVHFVSDVLPVLKERCFECHAGADAEEGIRLDVFDEVLNLTSPRHAEQSRLFQLVSNGKMPPDGPALTAEEQAVLRAWIDEGLEWDEQHLPTPVPRTKHWAFQPVVRPEVPSVQNSIWVRTPVDAFIAKQHERTGLSPAPPADGQTFRRRVYLDLIGMPPPVQGNRLGDGSVSENTVQISDSEIEELLSSSEFGERWGRHWLDVARWAESNGHQHNRHRPWAWRYRDWVINAMAADLPYDEFIRQQLAGDEIEPFAAEHIVATGFLAAARYSGNELDKQIQRNDILVDITNTTAQAFLGLTMECAQCHSHKFDPISIRDYYRFQAFFAQGQPGNVVLADDNSHARILVDEHWQLFDNVHQRLVMVKRRQGHPEPIYVIPKSVVGGMRSAEKKRFHEVNEQIAALPQSWSYYSPWTAASSLVVAPHEMRWPLSRDPKKLKAGRVRLLIRGDAHSPGPEVEPGWPLVLGAKQTIDPKRPRTSLAGWLTDPGNPLTARVWVNRIWQWHFGRGLVSTPADFGQQGTEPSHPQLLDYLASELISSGWSSRHIHRLILKSSTYRQSYLFSDKNADADPENKFWWRWQPHRLEAESVRDSILAVSGLLDSKRGGPGDAGDSTRRSIYLRQRRDNLPFQQNLFDGANAVTSCARRRVSTTLQQPLWLLNSEFAQKAAAAFAERAGSVRSAFQLAYGRMPDVEEETAMSELANINSLQSVCLAILNSSEFIYVP